MAIDINCSAAVADEVEALEDDIRGAAAVHPNRPYSRSKENIKIAWLMGAAGVHPTMPQ